jgi:hypothetical protein
VRLWHWGHGRETLKELSPENSSEISTKYSVINKIKGKGPELFFGQIRRVYVKAIQSFQRTLVKLLQKVPDSPLHVFADLVSRAAILPDWRPDATHFVIPLLAVSEGAEKALGISVVQRARDYLLSTPDPELLDLPERLVHLTLSRQIEQRQFGVAQHRQQRVVEVVEGEIVDLVLGSHHGVAEAECAVREFERNFPVPDRRATGRIGAVGTSPCLAKANGGDC